MSANPSQHQHKPTVVPEKSETSAITLTFSYDPRHFQQDPTRWDWMDLIGLSPLYFSILAIRPAVAPSPSNLNEINTQLLHALMYTHESWGVLTPRLVHPADHPIERIKVVPHNIGCMIRDSDPTGVYFHVELDPPHRAEIWSARAWRESITRRIRHAPEHTDNTFVTRRRRLHSDMLYAIAHKTRRKYDECSNIADLILDYGEDYDAILSLLDLSSELQTRLAEYRKDRVTQQATIPTPPSTTPA